MTTDTLGGNGESSPATARREHGHFLDRIGLPRALLAAYVGLALFKRVMLIGALVWAVFEVVSWPSASPPAT